MEAFACVFSLAFLLGVATISRCDDLDTGSTISLPFDVSDITEDLANVTDTDSNPTSSYSTRWNETGVNKITFNSEHGSTVSNFPTPSSSSFADERTTENSEVIRNNETGETPEASPSGPITESSFSRSAYVHPWLILNRITRETGRGDPADLSAEEIVSLSTESGSTEESDSTNFQFDGVGLSHSMSRISHAAEDEGPVESSNSKYNEEYRGEYVSDQPDLGAENSFREGREAGDHHEDFEGAEDRYPYWYRGRYFKERYWPTQRRRPYHSYLRYPVFPGK